MEMIEKPPGIHIEFCPNCIQGGYTILLVDKFKQGSSTVALLSTPKAQASLRQLWLSLPGNL